MFRFRAVARAPLLFAFAINVACGPDTAEPEAESPILAHTVMGVVQSADGAPVAGAAIRIWTYTYSCDGHLSTINSESVTTGSDGGFADTALLGDHLDTMRGCIRLLLTRPGALAVTDTIVIPDARFRLLLTEPRDTTRIDIVLPDAGSGP